MNTSSSVAPNQQEPYVRARDHPFFDGMRKCEAGVLMNKDSISDHQGKLTSKIYRSVSDIGDLRSRKTRVPLTEDATYITKNHPLDIVLEPISRSSSGRWSKTSSPLLIKTDLNINLHDSDEFPTISSPIVCEAKEEFSTLSDLARPVFQRSYSVSKRKINLSDVPLPSSAALFYNGPATVMEVVESCESVNKLNVFLKARRDEVNAGVPGRFLHAVIGPEVSDVGTVASTIMYAFYLDETLKNNQLCTVPVINMKRADLASRDDLQWLLHSCHIDLPILIFIDEIDLFYYDLFGSLKLVLVNCNKIPSEQEALRDAIIEVFGCTKIDASYSSVDSIAVRQDASCCTIVADIFALISPEILAGKGFSRLLLAGILTDTGNLSSPLCTSKDKYMATLLINGAGRFGFNELYQILKHKNYGSSDLKVREILQKEFKKWTRSDKPDIGSSRLLSSNIGMSSTGMSIAQLCSHDPTSIQEIIHFRKSENLGLLFVVSGYYDSRKKFKREILVCAESAEVMKSILLFLKSSPDQLPLIALHHQSSGGGLRDEMRVFEIEKVTSRKTIERLLGDYFSAAN